MKKQKTKVEFKLKTQKGRLDYKEGFWIENPKGQSKKIKI